MAASGPSRYCLKRVLVVVFAIVTPYTVTGCSAPIERLLPISGRVTVEGKPLALGWITFYPDGARGNTSSRLPFAEIRKDGTYELSTNGKLGAPAGFYKVVVVATHDDIPLKPRWNPDGKRWHPKWLVHEKYSTPDTTDLLVEVVERPSPGSYDLPLAR